MSKIKKIFRRLFRRSVVVKAQIAMTDASQKLKDKCIVITGGSGVIGKTMAKRFVAEGARVLICGRNEKSLMEARTEIGCESSILDLTKVVTFEAFLDKSIEKLGRIDCLINNAAVSLHESFQTVTPDGFDKQINTNFRGPFFLSQKVLAYMKENNVRGQVLFISSETGETADIRPYGLTKAAINSLVQGLAYLYAKEGIRINAIAPGVTASEMTGINKDNLYYPKNLNGRTYLPEEVAEVAVFLLSDASGCISGQIITCNNGNTINVRWK